MPRILLTKLKRIQAPSNNIQKEQRRKEEENIYKELKITLPIYSITPLSMEKRKKGNVSCKQLSN
jgi:hypothetical protein